MLLSRHDFPFCQHILEFKDTLESRRKEFRTQPHIVMNCSIQSSNDDFVCIMKLTFIACSIIHNEEYFLFVICICIAFFAGTESSGCYLTILYWPLLDSRLVCHENNASTSFNTNLVRRFFLLLRFGLTKTLWTFRSLTFGIFSRCQHVLRCNTSRLQLHSLLGMS